MKIIFATLSLSMFFASGAVDQLFGSVACGAEPTTVRLWEGDAPGALGSEEKDIPTAIVYLPAKASAPTGAIVICPGGGYGHLAIDHEGHQIAAWANEMGLAGIIVSYRHRQRGYGHPAPMLDAQRDSPHTPECLPMEYRSQPSRRNRLLRRWALGNDRFDSLRFGRCKLPRMRSTSRAVAPTLVSYAMR
ncbi:MAG: hypothetical protein R3C56_26405 [Pirellulaceae bacterium]